MKPKPEVRVLARKLFGASERHIKSLGFKSTKWSVLSTETVEVWDAVAREAIRRLKK